MTTWFDDLMIEIEKKEEDRRIQMNKIRCDQVLQAISVLEIKIAEVNDIASKERAILDEWEQSQTSKLERQVDWLARQLEAFIRSADQKSIVLPHGSIHLRMGRPKVSVVDMVKFLPVGEKFKLIREKPSSKEADLNAINAYIRRVGTPPPGIAFTPATVSFHYKTKGQSDEQQSSETRDSGNADQVEAATQ